MSETNDKTHIGTEFIIDSMEVGTEYRLNSVLKHLKMSTFDYDIEKDIIYIRKDSVMLHDFTDNWFKEKGDYYCLERVTDKLKELIRESFVNIAFEYLEAIKNNVSGEMISVDVPLVYKAGNSKWTNFMFDTILDEDGKAKYAIGYCKDIHEEKKELYRLRNVAQTDSLTGLRSRAAGMARMEGRIKEFPDAKYFVAVIDLDKFKSANDLFGHSFGDLILKNVSDILREFFDHDTICCRTGGDEFLFFRLCEDTDYAMEFLTRLKNRLKHTVAFGNEEFLVDASIGFSIYPDNGTDFETLYNKADIAMYHCKNKGSEVPVLYEDTMSEIRKA